MLTALAIALLSLPTPPPVADSLWPVEPDAPWLTVDNLTERIERSRDEIALKCGAAHPAQDTVDLRVRAVLGRQVFFTAASPDTPFARCVAGYLDPSRPPSGGKLGELPPRRYFEQRWSWYTFDRRVTLKLPAPADVLRERLDEIGRHGLDCWGFGDRPVRELRMRLISNPTETRVEVTTDPPEPITAGCFQREAERRLGHRDGGQWAVELKVRASEPTYLTERRLQRAMESKVCRAMTRCLDEPVPPADCPPSSLCIKLDGEYRSHLAENVKRLGLPEEVSITARGRVVSPANPLEFDVAQAEWIDARLEACIEREIKTKSIQALVHRRQPIGPFIDATPEISLTKQCKTSRSR